MAGERQEFERKEEKGGGQQAAAPEQQQPPREPARAEAAAIQRFINYKQSTHNVVVTNSVGTAILKLKDRYFGKDPTDVFVEEQIKTCVTELQKIAEAKATEHLKPGIESILKKIKEPLHPQLDRVTLSTPNGQEVYGFHLSEVLTLVWMSLKDHARYTHHYQGTPEEKLKAAEKDYPARLENFWSCLERMRTDQVCHHGDRNELVFVLNETHEDVHLIEDGRLTVMAFLKDNINKAFKEAYQQKEDPALKKLLLDWMETQDASAILKSIDPDNKIIKSLETFFLKHGVDPKGIELPKLIQECIVSLEFSCNPKEDEFLYHLNQVLNFSEDPTNLEKTNSLRKIKEWIKSEAQLESKETQEKIKQFYQIYRLHDEFVKNKFILVISGKLSDEIKSIIERIESYFKDSNQPPPTPEQIQAAHLAIETAKKDSMRAEIENFFAKWFGGPYNDPLKKTLYQILITPQTQEKIKLNDDIIQQFLQKRNPNSGELNVSPYELNLIFLHAIITDTNDWTPLFTKVFNEALQFVENNFNQENKGIAYSLKKDSYPEPLRDQLKYLKAKKENNPSQREPWYIYLPEHIQTIEEWDCVLYRLNEENVHRIFQKYKVKIEKIIKDFLDNKVYKADDFYNTLEKYIPKEHRINFLKELKKKNKRIKYLFDNFILNLSRYFNNAVDPSKVIALLLLFPTENIIDFIRDQDISKDSKFINLNDLIKILNLIPKKDWLEFIKTTHIKSAETLEISSFQKYKIQVLDFFKFLPVEHFIEIVKDLEIKIYIQNFYNENVNLILKHVPEKDWAEFIKIQKIDIGQAIRIISQLKELISHLSLEHRPPFIRSQLISLLKSIPKEEHNDPVLLNSIATFEDVKFVLNTCHHEADKLLFMRTFAHKIKDFIDIQQLAKLLREFDNPMTVVLLFPIKELVKSHHDLGHILQAIPLSEWPSFVEKTNLTADIIKNVDDLFFLLKNLPKPCRTPFLKALKIDFKSYNPTQDQVKEFDALMPSFAKSFVALFTRKAEPKPFDAREKPQDAPAQDQQRGPESK